MRMLLYICLVPLKLFVLLIGLAIMPVMVTVNWQLDLRGESFDRHAIYYILHLLSIFKFKSEDK